MPIKRSQQKPRRKKEWPVVVYLWSIGLGGFGYFIGETAVRTTQPHTLFTGSWQCLVESQALVSVGSGIAGVVMYTS